MHLCCKFIALGLITVGGKTLLIYHNGFSEKQTQSKQKQGTLAVVVELDCMEEVNDIDSLHELESSDSYNSSEETFLSGEDIVFDRYVKFRINRINGMISQIMTNNPSAIISIVENTTKYAQSIKKKVGKII